MKAQFTHGPLASSGLTSYRYRGPFGMVYIGATDDADALNEAARSITQRRPNPANLEVWGGSSYVPSCIALSGTAAIGHEFDKARADLSTSTESTK